MPRGPKGEKRPADVIGNAILIGRIATGEVEDKTVEKNPAAVALGRLGGLKGGKARAASQTGKQRKTLAKRAAKARWNKNET